MRKKKKEEKQETSNKTGGQTFMVETRLNLQRRKKTINLINAHNNRGHT